MAPFSVVPNLDIFEDCHLCPASCRKVTMVYHLGLQGLEKALRYRIVPTVSFTAHTLDHRISPQCFPELIARILNTSIRVKQQRLDDDRWEEWILFILKGVEETSIQTIELIKDIKKLMQEYKRKIRDELPKIYSQKLLNNLFKHPYTKIDFGMEDVGIQRITASRYLDSLVSLNLLDKYKIGRSNYYLNTALYELFLNANSNKQ